MGYIEAISVSALLITAGIPLINPLKIALLRWILIGEAIWNLL